MPDFSSDIPFAKDGQKSATGFESALPNEESPTLHQRRKTEDLFLRGVVSNDLRKAALESQSGFEAIIGRSNFLPAVFLEVGARVSQATCMIRAAGTNYRGLSGQWTGTGFLISPNLLMTNNHVLNSTSVARAANCVFDFQLDETGQPMRTKSYRLRPDRLFVTSAAIGGLDFTVVWVDESPGVRHGSVQINRRAFTVGERDFANVVGHPSGRMKEVSIQENTVLWQDQTVVHYTSDTEHGSSGASVANNEWHVFALHHANKPSQVDDHSVLNEGIKLSAIAAHLESLAQGDDTTSRHASEVLQVFNGVDEELGFFGSLGRTSQGENDLESVVNQYHGTEQDIDVGFWNVEWLSNRWQAKTKAVARVIHSMNLDVWALEEASPDATEALVEELRESYQLDYGWLAAEPDAGDGKQSCTIIWNQKTVECEKDEWGEPIETWLRAHSRDFDDLGFEALHGKIFNRYPALFKVTSRATSDELELDFYLVALHLKAKSEGSIRRRMASQILAAAVQHRIDNGADQDWIIGGDVNAELASGDFAKLVSGGLTPVSARDEEDGAFTYLKFHKSLIDHIFLSENLAEKHGPDSFFVVAADKEIPGFVRDVSDHRPVLLRMSLSEQASLKKASDPAMEQLKEFLRRERADIGRDSEFASEFEARDNLSDRQGFDVEFLGKDSHRVDLPSFSEVVESTAVIVNHSAANADRYRLNYVHYTVAMNGDRRMPIYSAVNIDGNQLRSISRPGWKRERRIGSELQCLNDIYINNDLDKGHMTRRLDPVWGPPAVAAKANKDSMFYTNAVPQHMDLNQKDWVRLEDYVLKNAELHDLKVSVFTGPVFGENDKPYRGINLPEEFWKVVVILRKDSAELSATGYMLTQKDLITGFEFVFGEFKTYQVAITEIESKTGLDFENLRDFDPKASRGGFEAASQPSRVIGPSSLIF